MATRWIDHILGPAVEADRPDPSAAPVGALFQNSDTGDLEINTGTAWDVYRSAVAAGVASIVAGTNVTVDDTDPANPIISATGGGGGGTVKDPRWNVLTGQTSIDEFNDSSLDAAWSRVDGTGAASGNLTVAEDGDVVSLFNQGGDTANVFHGLVRPLSGAGGSLSNGDGFVTCATVAAPANTRYSLNGLVLSDSASIGSGKQVMAGYNIVDAGGSGTNGQPYSNWNTPGTPTSNTLSSAYLQGPVYLRLALISANTWRADTSLDCVNWLIGATFSQTFTPTHVGFSSSSYGTSTKGIASYEFLRRVSGVT